MFRDNYKNYNYIPIGDIIIIPANRAPTRLTNHPFIRSIYHKKYDSACKKRVTCYQCKITYRLGWLLLNKLHLIIRQCKNTAHMYVYIFFALTNILNGWEEQQQWSRVEYKQVSDKTIKVVIMLYCKYATYIWSINMILIDSFNGHWYTQSISPDRRRSSLNASTNYPYPLIIKIRDRSIKWQVCNTLINHLRGEGLPI